MIGALLTITIVVMIHEGCHAMAMLKHGVKIEEFSIGFPVKYVPRIKFSSPHILAGTKIIINPLLLGGYVKPKYAEQIEELPFSAQVDIYSAGVVGNFISAFLFAAVYFFLTKKGDALLENTFLVFVTIFPLLFFKRGKIIVDSLIVPLWGIITVAFLFFHYYNAPDASAVTGPIGTISILSDRIVDPLSFLLSLGVISVSLGAINAVPLGFLDGGRVVRSIMERFGLYKLADGFSMSTAYVFAMFLIYVLIADVYKAIF